MPLTAKQLQLRRKHLTATEMPALAGASPFASPADVYFAKHDGIELTELDSTAAKMGTYAEPGILQFAQEEIGGMLTRANPLRVSKEDPLFSATHDALVVGRHEGVEAKLTSLVDEWADGPPEYVQVQCQMQMFVSKLALVWVPVMLVGFRGRMQMHKVERDDEMIGELRGVGHAFWDRFVVPGLIPLDFAPSMQTIRRIVRKPNKTVPLDPELVQQWEVAKRLRKAYEDAADDAQNRMLAALGDAECGDLGDGRKLMYVHQRGQWTFDREAMKADGVLDKYGKQGTYPVPRIKKPKATKG